MEGDKSTSEAFSLDPLIWIMLCTAKCVYIIFFVSIGACVVILSLPINLLDETVIWSLFYFHPAKPPILDNELLHREYWNEQKGQVFLRIPSVWTVSLGSFKAASCLILPEELTRSCRNLNYFEIIIILSVLLILVQTEWSH